MTLKLVRPAAGTRDGFDIVRTTTEWAFKSVAWLGALATLQYGSVKTQSAYFLVPELILAFLVTILLQQFVRCRVALELPATSRPWLDRMSQAAAISVALLIMFAVLMLIEKMVDKAVCFQVQQSQERVCR